MNGIRTGFGRDVNCAGRSQVLRKIERGLAELKFINRAGGNVGSCRTHSFIADIHAIDVDARGASETSAERNRRITRFRRIEILTILNLYAGLELSEIEEVAAIDRQILNLGRGQNTLHGSLLRVYLHRSSSDLNNLAFLTKLQSGVG